MDAQQVDIQPTDQEFNPKPLLTKIDIKNKQGQVVGQKDYLGAHEAITWFHADYPLPIGRILTFPDFEHHAVRAEIWVGDVLIATGHSISEGSKSMEKLETNAVRRALANAGYGTIAALAHDDDDDAIKTQARAAMVAHELDERGVDVREKLGSGKGRKMEIKQQTMDTQPDDYPNLRVVLRDLGINGIASITPCHDLEGMVRIEYSHPRNVAWVRKELAKAIGEDRLGEMRGTWCNVRWSEQPSAGAEE